MILNMSAPVVAVPKIGVVKLNSVFKIVPIIEIACIPHVVQMDTVHKTSSAKEIKL